jgi:hypothetical protein
MQWCIFNFAGNGSLTSVDIRCGMTHSGEASRADNSKTVRNDLVGKLADHLKRGNSFKVPLPNGQSVWLPSMPFED